MNWSKTSLTPNSTGGSLFIKAEVCAPNPPGWLWRSADLTGVWSVWQTDWRRRVFVRRAKVFLSPSFPPPILFLLSLVILLVIHQVDASAKLEGVVGSKRLELVTTNFYLCDSSFSSTILLFHSFHASSGYLYTLAYVNGI